MQLKNLEGHNTFEQLKGKEAVVLEPYHASGSFFSQNHKLALGMN
jgi:hypothetical protein